MSTLKESLKLNTDFSTIWEISWPVILSSGALTFVNITDAKFLGILGEQELGASSLAGNIFFIFFMVAQALGVGTQILIAKFAGQEKMEKLFLCFFNSFQIQLMVGILLTIFSLFIVPIIVAKFYVGDQVMNYLVEYVIHRSWGIVPMFIAMVYRSYFTGIGYTRIIMWASLWMALVNVPLDYILIFGWEWIPAFGVKGAAHASALSELIGAFILFWYLFNNRKLTVKGPINHYFTKNLKMMKEILHISTPLVIQFLVANTSWFLFFILIQKVGDRELAISSVAKHLLLFLMVPTWGFAGAANTIVSNVIGQGRKEELFKFSIKIVSFCFVASLIIAGLNYIFAASITSFFMTDQSFINDGVVLVRMVSVFIVLGGVSCVFFNILTGTSDTKSSMIIEIITILFYLIYCFYFLYYNYINIYLAWGSEVVYWGSLGILSIFRLKQKHW